MEKIYLKRKPIKCPKCGHRPVASYQIGMPYQDFKLDKDVMDGKVILTGCAIIIDGPKWHCANCKTDFYNEDNDLFEF